MKCHILFSVFVLLGFNIINGSYNLPVTKKEESFIRFLKTDKYEHVLSVDFDPTNQGSFNKEVSLFYEHSGFKQKTGMKKDLHLVGKQIVFMKYLANRNISIPIEFLCAKVSYVKDDEDQSNCLKNTEAL